MNETMQSPGIEQAGWFRDLASRRRSIRGFLPEALSGSTLDSIFEIANTAPSNCNTQPWQTYVASGQKRDQISKGLLETVGKGENQLDFPYGYRYEDEFRQRQLDVGLMLYEALGVTREDKEGKQRAFLRNLEFFGAPHVAFIFMPDWGNVREACDVGMYAQNLMLSMAAHGAASCPQTILGYNCGLVREAFGIESNMKLLFGISFGIEDKSLPENQIVPERASLSDNTHFYE